MKKEGIGKKGQLNESSQSAPLLTTGLILASLAVLVSYVNPLSMVMASRVFPIASYAALGLSGALLIITVIAFFTNQKSWGLLFETFAIAFFNAAFLFPQEIITFGVSIFILMWAMVLSAISVGKQQFKDVNITLIVTQVLLAILQVIVILLIMTGRLVVL